MVGTRLLILFALVCGCRTGRPGGSVVMSSPVTATTDAQGLTLLSSADLKGRGTVNAIRLDEAEFRVSNVRVGEQVFLRQSAAIVQYQMPKDADYVDILRCPADVVISGGSDRLEDVAIYAPSEEAETAIFQRNNFWASASQTSGCVLVASSYTDVSFIDSFADTGKFYYFLHACVDKTRLTNTEQFSTINCSRQVTRSAPNDHTNKRSQQEMDQLEQASRIRNQIDTIVRSISLKTELLWKALYDCQERNKQRGIVSSEQKDNLRNILTIGVGLGGAAVGAIAGGAAGAYAAGSKSRLRGAIVGGAIGTVVGGGIGAAVGYMSGSVEKALSFRVNGIPKDNPLCYSRDLGVLVSPIEEDGQRVCSCADIEYLEGDLRSLNAELVELNKLYGSIYSRLGGQP